MGYSIKSMGDTMSICIYKGFRYGQISRLIVCLTTLTKTVEIVGEVMRDNNLTQFFVFVICAKLIFQNLTF